MIGNKIQIYSEFSKGFKKEHLENYITVILDIVLSQYNDLFSCSAKTETLSF